MATDIQTRIGIMADYADPKGYEALTPEQEAVLRQQHEVCLYGTKETEVKDLLASATYKPLLPNVNDSGHPGVTAVFDAVVAAVDAYNALGTGLAFQPLASTQPTCVENEWVDGELITRYNYALLPDPEDGPCPPAGPPKAEFRVQLRYIQP